MSFHERYGPWALVTGAARGVGAAFAAELVARGVKVIGVDKDPAGLEEQARGLAEAGGELVPVTLDLGTEGLDAAIDAAVGDRTVGLLVNCAATVPPGSFLEHDLSALRRELRVNCEAAMVLAHRLGREMKARGRGGMVFVSSLSMLHGTPVFAHYAATKAYDAVLAQGLYEELRAVGVDVTTVLGPLIDTPGLHESKPAQLPRTPISARAVARAALDGLGRTGRVIVGRDGHLVTGVLARMMPHELLRRFVASNVRRMYPDQG